MGRSEEGEGRWGMASQREGLKGGLAKMEVRVWSDVRGWEGQDREKLKNRVGKKGMSGGIMQNERINQSRK